jgi:energy-coupling factor transport system substrate-specific component
MNRDNKINGVHTSLIRITLEGQEGSPVTDEATDAFEEVLLTNLKKNDVVSRYSGQFFVLFSDEQDNDAESRISKIESKWKESEEHKNYLIRMEKDSIG